MKKILSLLLIFCICFGIVGCNKVINTDSSSLSSTITETKNDSIYVDEKNSSSNNINTEESKNNSVTSSSTEESKPSSNSVPENSESTKNIHVHTYASASCTEAKKCSCGVSLGDPLGHKWNEATCQTPKICSVCYQTEGETVGHVMIQGVCKWCNKRDNTSETTSNDEKQLKKLMEIQEENQRHEDAIEKIKSNYNAKIIANQSMIDLNEDMMTGYYSESTLNSLYSQVEQKERKLSLLQMGNGSKVEIQKLQNEIYSLRQEIANMERNKILSNDIAKYKAEIANLEKSMQREINEENAKHNSNISNIEKKYT